MHAFPPDGDSDGVLQHIHRADRTDKLPPLVAKNGVLLRLSNSRCMRSFTPDGDGDGALQHAHGAGAQPDAAPGQLSQRRREPATARGRDQGSGVSGKAGCEERGRGQKEIDILDQ